MEFRGKSSKAQLHGILSGIGTSKSMKKYPWNSIENYTNLCTLIKILWVSLGKNFLLESLFPTLSNEV